MLDYMRPANATCLHLCWHSVNEVVGGRGRAPTACKKATARLKRCSELKPLLGSITSRNCSLLDTAAARWAAVALSQLVSLRWCAGRWFRQRVRINARASRGEGAAAYQCISGYVFCCFVTSSSRLIQLRGTTERISGKYSPSCDVSSTNARSSSMLLMSLALT